MQPAADTSDPRGAELHDAGRAASPAAAARFRVKLVGQADPAGEQTARVLAGDRGRGQARPFSAADLVAVLATCENGGAKIDHSAAV